MSDSRGCPARTLPCEIAGTMYRKAARLRSLGNLLKPESVAKLSSQDCTIRSKSNVILAASSRPV